MNLIVGLNKVIVSVTLAAEVLDPGPTQGKVGCHIPYAWQVL